MQHYWKKTFTCATVQTLKRSPNERQRPEGAEPLTQAASNSLQTLPSLAFLSQKTLSLEMTQPGSQTKAAF